LGERAAVEGGTEEAPGHLTMPALAALFLLVFLAALRTAAPTVAFDDTGEAALAALQLGVPHPPGYPLFTMLSSLWIRLPASSPVFRLNLLAAACAAVAAVLASAFWRAAGGRSRYAGAAASILAVLFLASWNQAGLGKGAVYMLNLCLTLGFLVSSWNRETPVRSVLVSSLLFGLGLAHHWMSMAGLVPALVWVVCRGDGASRGRKAALAMFGVAAGCSLYLFLPIRASAFPFLNWGDPCKFTDFLFVLGRRQYLSVLPGEEVAALRDKLDWLLATLNGAVPWPILLVLAAAGMWGWRKRGVAAMATLVFLPAAVFSGLLFSVPVRPGAHWFVETYSISAVAVLILLACGGLEALAVLLSPRRGVAMASAALALVIMAVIPGRWRENDRSADYFTWDQALNLAGTSLDGRGLVYGASDSVVFGNWYLWLVEERTGVAVVPVPLMPMPWVARGFPPLLPELRAPFPAPHIGAESVPALLRAWGTANASSFPEWIFLTDQAQAAFGRQKLVPEGWMYRIAGSGPGSGMNLRMRHLRFRGLFGPNLSRDARQDASIRPIAFSGLLTYGRGLSKTDPRAALHAFRQAEMLAWSEADAAECILEAGNLDAQHGRSAEAEALYRKAMKMDPSLTVAARNLAMLLLSVRRPREALELMKKIGIEAPRSEEAAELAPIMRRLEKYSGSGDNTPR